jgi:hypothetical protein
MGKRPAASERADLGAAPRFVIGRIEEEANRSGSYEISPKDCHAGNTRFPVFWLRVSSAQDTAIKKASTLTLRRNS